jgi:hypothetical protein
MDGDFRSYSANITVAGNLFCDYENSRRVITGREQFDILSVALKFTSKVFRAYNEGSNTAFF